MGPPAPEQSEIHAAVRAAQEAATAAVAPGVSAEEIDRVARRTITDAGYGEYFIHRTGHGIGLEGHEHPYLVEGNSEKLEPGMCFSIEPGHLSAGSVRRSHRGHRHRHGERGRIAQPGQSGPGAGGLSL